MRPCDHLSAPYKTRSQSIQTATSSPQSAVVIVSPTVVNWAGTSFRSLELWVALPHTHSTNMCVLTTHPPWCLIPPHFSRPLLLSNCGSSEYNYGENHPGLMWGWINGIKEIIFWPSGPATVWGWEGNLKQREEERGWVLMRGLMKSLWPPRASLNLPLGDYFPRDSSRQSCLTPHIYPSAHTLTPSRMFTTTSKDAAACVLHRDQSQIC